MLLDTDNDSNSFSMDLTFEHADLNNNGTAESTIISMHAADGSDLGSVTVYGSLMTEANIVEENGNYALIM